ncbi:hypothetical protein DER46DRAFT_67291 [Fusarium sp. MPI-SDFR-AT-0072]|nr:hypothetical protein DER46DRAFT_67291 [Fusarium sp. MPI-SDFR-AT-0072]
MQFLGNRAVTVTSHNSTDYHLSYPLHCSAFTLQYPTAGILLDDISTKHRAGHVPVPVPVHILPSRLTNQFDAFFPRDLSHLANTCDTIRSPDGGDSPPAIECRCRITYCTVGQGNRHMQSNAWNSMSPIPRSCSFLSFFASLFVFTYSSLLISCVIAATVYNQLFFHSYDNSIRSKENYQLNHLLIHCLVHAIHVQLTDSWVQNPASITGFTPCTRNRNSA